MKKLNSLFILALFLLTSFAASAQRGGIIDDAMRRNNTSRSFASGMLQVGQFLDCDPWDDSKPCTDIVDPWGDEKPTPKDPKTPTDPKDPKDPKKPADPKDPKKPSGQSSTQQQNAMNTLEQYILKGKAGKYLTANFVHSARKRYAGKSLKSLRLRYKMYAQKFFECWPCK